MDTQALLRRLPRPTHEKDAWSAGVDYALNGANRLDSHFTFFSTRERKNQWEAGRDAAIAELAKDESEHAPGHGGTIADRS